MGIRSSILVYFYWMFEKTIFMRNPDSGRRVDLSWLEDLWNLNFRSEAWDIFRQRQRQCKDFCKSFSWISVRETSLFQWYYHGSGDDNKTFSFRDGRLGMDWRGDGRPAKRPAELHTLVSLPSLSGLSTSLSSLGFTWQSSTVKKQ